MRVSIYGGTNINPGLARFVRQLTRHLLAVRSVHLVSGGFQFFRGYKNRTSVDVAVMEEAERLLGKAGMKARFETWLPSPALDRRSVIRFKRGMVRELKGSSQARRFALVQGVDALATVVGEGNTRTVLELAFALNTPALPLPFTGGDSRRVWRKNADLVCERLDLAPGLKRRLQEGPDSARGSNLLARDVAAVLCRAAVRRCLVLMPYGGRHDRFYTRFLYDVIKKAGYAPHRIDQDDYAGNIRTIFVERMKGVEKILIDVTGASPNVMYELGRVHAAEVEPFILRRSSKPVSDCREKPFYLRSEKVLDVVDSTTAWESVREPLTKFLNQH